MNQAWMPVLIGAGQITEKLAPAVASTPVQLMAEVARRAATDAGPGDALLQEIDTLVTVALIVDNPEASSVASGAYPNLPRSVSNELGIAPDRQFTSVTGGNTPQMLVNRFAEKIAQGETLAVLLTGAEALNSMVGRLKSRLDMSSWRDSPGGTSERIGEDRAPCNPHESSYGLQTPSITYPLFENALRGKYGWSLDEHRMKLGDLYQRFCRVAADNPLAWFPTNRSSIEISTPSPSNRYVGFPYTKYLNSIMQVNQGAAVIMTSLEKARELGVADSKMVYLHGCSDGNDIWNISERVNYHSSPAVGILGEKALRMANKTIDDMSFFDIYSCFPSAVQIACDELGLAHDDPRGLTITGGLPYFGGPGNNYVMHSIATMMDVLRRNPGKYGLLNANGWFVTKHSLGIYSTNPVQGDWQREDPASYQGQILAQGCPPPFNEKPEGKATVETYTVQHGRGGAERGLVIGRLGDGSRFIAETPDDEETLQGLKDSDALGLPGTVSQVSGKNIFVPAL